MVRTRVLSQEILKLIACICMLIDHVGAIFFPHMIWLRWIGRLAFPVFCFLLVEGMSHTRNPKKYLLRMVLCFFLSELPYDYALYGGFTWQAQNVMLTLALGGGMLLAFRAVKTTWLRLMLMVAVAAMAELLRCDYGAYGILLIGILALVKNRWAMLGLVLLMGTVYDFRMPFRVLRTVLAAGMAWKEALTCAVEVWIPVQVFSGVAMLPICLYSGQKLTRSRVVQRGFYLFYPVHLAVLWVFAKFLL